MKVTLKKAFSWIGPYPYNPTLIFSFFSACYFSRFIPVIIQQPHGLPRYKTAIEMLILAGAPSLVFASVAFLIQKYRKWSSSSLIIYILEVTFGQSFLFLIAPLVRRYLESKHGFEYQAPLTISLGFYFGTLVLILLALGLLHRAELSILKRLQAADRLAEQLEKARESLIFSDEELRRQTSQFLHDRVQSDLMVVAMKLKSIQGESSRENQDVISKAIARLEKTRTSDLRNLVQILTPNFQGAGFIESVKTLCNQFQIDYGSTFDISSRIEKFENNQQLGLFRIIEQSLLNSLVHAQSKNVRVTLSVSAHAFVLLKITDDGPGADLSLIRPGVGSSVIDSWVSILKAKKEIATRPGEGYTLTVTYKK